MTKRKTLQQLRAERLKERRRLAALRAQQKPKPKPQPPVTKVPPQKPKRRPARKPQKPKPKPIPKDLKGWDLPKETVESFNHTAFIVGGGPSLKGFNWKLLDGKFVFAINRAYEVLPNAQAIYCTDDDWYHSHKLKIHEHKGQVIKGSLNLNRVKDDRIIQYYLTGANGLEKTPGCLKHGRNSTHAVINLAVQLGFKKLYLLGVDMRWGQKGVRKTSHWHDGHKRIDGEQVYKMMINHLTNLANTLKETDIEVINVNTEEGTKLKVFPIQTFEEVFGPLKS